jgi:hypothetical protein
MYKLYKNISISDMLLSLEFQFMNTKLQYSILWLYHFTCARVCSTVFNAKRDPLPPNPPPGTTASDMDWSVLPADSLYTWNDWLWLVGEITAGLHQHSHSWLQSKSHYDRQSVGQSVLVSGAHLGPLTNFSFSLRLSFRHLTVCYVVASSLMRGRVCNLL